MRVSSSSQVAGTSTPENIASITPGNSVKPTNPPVSTAAVIVVGGVTVIGNTQSGFVIGSSTLTPGGTVVIPGANGALATTFVLPASGTAVIVNGATQNVQESTPPAFIPQTTSATIFTAGGSTFTGNSASVFLIGSSTLTPGGTVVISGVGSAPGTTYVLPATGSTVIVNGVTQSIQETALPTSAPQTIPVVIFTAGGSTFTGNSESGFIIGSSTLTPGGTVIVPGSGTDSPTTYVLPTSGTAIIVNGATQTIQVTTASAASTGGMGGVIASVGGYGTSIGSGAPAQITGSEGRREDVPWVLGGGLLGVVIGMIVL